MSQHNKQTPLPNNSEQLTHPKYRADIDGLRAIAVLSVVIFHAFPKTLRGGFIGVDIFFVISGFLISTIIFSNLERGSFSFVEFYSRRIKRIFPALLLVLIACFTAGWFFLFADKYQQLGKHIAGGAGFISNFMFWNESGYFDDAAETKPLLHLWSLGIEEQFYIVWPLLLWFAWKQRLNFLTITIIVFIISFTLNISNIHSDAVATFYSPQTRFWELLIGSVLAYITLYWKNKFNHSVSLHNVQSSLGAVLIITGIIIITKASFFPGYWAILPTVGTALIISAGTKAWLNRTVLSNRVIVWFGLISFPLYLWHWPLLSFVRIIEYDKPAKGIRFAAVLISIFLAWLTYKLIEKPIRLSKRSNGIIITLIILMVGVGFSGYYIYERDGLEFRLQHASLKSLPIKYPHDYHNEKCDTLFLAFKKYSVCLLSKENKPDTVIFGDSHSNHYYNSLSKALPNNSVMNLGVWSCFPFSSQTFQSQYNCREKFDAALNFLKNEESIKKIYLTGYWSSLAAGEIIINDNGSRQARPLTPEESLSFQKNGEELITALIAAKKEVIVIRDTPDLNFNIKACFHYRPFAASTEKLKNPCAMDKSDYEKRISIYNLSLSELLKKFPQVKVFDPKSIFCDNTLCWGIKNNESLYFDSDHLTIYGADLVIKELLSSETR